MRRAVDLDPSLAAARLRLGVVPRRLGDLDGTEARRLTDGDAREPR